MGYTADSLIPVMAHIAKNVVKVNDGLTKHMVSARDLKPNLTPPHTYTHTLTACRLQAVKGKYSTSKQMRIATIPQLKSSVVKDYAKKLAQ